MPGSDGFGENPQAPLESDDDHIIDESIFGPQKVLTAEEQAEYDAWFIRQVEKAVEYSKQPDAVYSDHEDVMKRMWERLERRIAEAQKSED
ncbi:MAG: hypothetical protein JWM58_1669 [Rhizobium sp.]|nr:hypothetical protein [Rhizobium sp.]